MTRPVQNPLPNGPTDFETIHVKPDLSTRSQTSHGSALLHEHMMAVLRLASTGDAIPLETLNRVVIGRRETGSLQQVHIDLTAYHAREMGVSRRHAVIYRMKHSLFMEDLNSANGSYLNGQRLLPGQPRLLRNGDELRLGKLCCYIEFT
jgi:hypothetical protein